MDVDIWRVIQSPEWWAVMLVLAVVGNALFYYGRLGALAFGATVSNRLRARAEKREEEFRQDVERVARSPAERTDLRFRILHSEIRGLFFFMVAVAFEAANFGLHALYERDKYKTPLLAAGNQTMAVLGALLALLSIVLLQWLTWKIRRMNRLLGAARKAAKGADSRQIDVKKDRRSPEGAA